MIKHKILLSLLVFLPIVSFTQLYDPDNYMEHITSRHYRSVFPLIKEEFQWKDWEIQKDSAYKMNEIKKYKGDYPINFSYPGNYEEGEEELYPIYHSSLHFIDYNGDGTEDIIYEEFIAMNVGIMLKFLRGFGSHYQHQYTFQGTIVKMGNQNKTGAKWFTIHVYPCCDGYVHNLETYSPFINNDSVIYKQTEKLTYVESNIRRIKNLPYKFNLDKKFIINTECFLYYNDKKPVYAKLEYETSPKETLKSFFPFAVYEEGATGVVLAEKISTEGDKMFFVKIDKSNRPKASIDHLSRNNNILQPRRNIESIVGTNYLGWINSKNIEITE